MAYKEGRYEEAVELIRPLRYKIQNIGGSNAQVSTVRSRDVFCRHDGTFTAIIHTMTVQFWWGSNTLRIEVRIF